MPSTTTTLNSSPCSICGYPIPEATYKGQQVKCPYCGTIHEAIAQVTIPTSVLVGFLCFGAGMLFGRASLAYTQAGEEWLTKKARARIGK